MKNSFLIISFLVIATAGMCQKKVDSTALQLKELKADRSRLAAKIEKTKLQSIGYLEMLSNLQLKYEGISSGIDSLRAKKRMLQQKKNPSKKEKEQISFLTKYLEESKRDMNEIKTKIDAGNQKYNAALVELDRAIGMQNELDELIKKLEQKK
jgi:hypothetical protein